MTISPSQQPKLQAESSDPTAATVAREATWYSKPLTGLQLPTKCLTAASALAAAVQGRQCAKIQRLSLVARVKGLSGLNHLHKAGAGGNGRKQKAAGSRGRDCTVQVCSNAN